MNHTLACTKMALENNSWLQRWPKACKECGGVGSWQTPAMGWNPPDGGPCPKCTEEGQCPRCGEDLILINKVTYEGVEVKYDPCDYGLCVHCGWNEYLVVNHYNVAHDLGMVIPHLDHECECWMKDDPEQKELPMWEEPVEGIPTDKMISDMVEESEKKNRGDNQSQCPICGDWIILIGKTEDGRLIGSCHDAFTVAQWNSEEE